MKLIFMGTPQIAVRTLEALAAEHDVVAVVTRSDKPVGRSKEPVPSPVAAAALRMGIDTYKPEVIDSGLIDSLKKYGADYFVTFAYGKILKQEFFDVALNGGLNIHPSMLPDLRGASPLQSALLAGYVKTGITIQKIVLKVDAGDIVAQKDLDINGMDIIELEDYTSGAAAGYIVETLADIKNITPIPQNESRATYCKMINKEDGLIDWDLESGAILNKIRAFADWPGAYTFLDGKKLTVYKAVQTECAGGMGGAGEVVSADAAGGLVVKCGRGALKIEVLQLEGKNRLGAREFLNGYRNMLSKQFKMER